MKAYQGREIGLGALDVRRVLPVKGKRLIGPWCFVDRYGPVSFTDDRPMDVASHPHIGLQTVTWLLDGEVVHYDSLGNEALLRAGGVNVMTSGAAIAHAEQTPAENSGRLNGVQLWVALPDSHRRMAARFQHLAETPIAELPGGLVQVFAGSVESASSSAEHYSEIVGADLRVHAGTSLTIPLRAGWEHALVALDGDCSVGGEQLRDGVLYELDGDSGEAAIASRDGGRVLLTGGPPFGERILMWWNFVARTPEEIADARTAWEAHRRFGEVPGYAGPRLSAPTLLRLAAPNPVS